VSTTFYRLWPGQMAVAVLRCFGLLPE